MADLDDFFAKKDRKKSKNVKKFTTTDEIAKKLEDSGKKSEKPIKKDRSNQDGDDPNQEAHEQDEWKDFEEEKKDYTGLKIGHLSISNENSPQGDNESGGSGQGGDGISGDGRGSGSAGGESGGQSGESTHIGPWKRVQSAPQAEQQPEVVTPEAESEPQAKSTSGYIAPHLRNASRGPSGGSSAGGSSGGRLRNKTAPDIHNEEFFPTLSGAAKPETGGGGAWGKRTRNEGSFEEVRHSKAGSLRHAEQSKPSQSGPRLNLGNRYGTLSSDS